MPDDDLPSPEPPPPEQPTLLGGVSPDEMLARGMQSVKMTSGTAGTWQPPTIEEAARLFPGYEVLRLLGRGGMGAVYQARQIELDRLVAIKLLPLEISVDKDFADRFRREARAMARLNHPHIITVYDFGTTSEGHLFFVMEFVEGANLADIIHQAGLTGDQALSIVEQVCTALAYAHGKGIVHRDIKPANVMIDMESHVKVADFGLARLTDPSAEQYGHTMTGTVMGTPDYMAPEQMKGMNVDHRADIYSLGVMVYEMLCREVPRGAFEPPSVRIGCDPRIDPIVIKAMQPNPERRYQSTQEMKTDVTAAREPVSAPPPAAPAGMSKPLPPSPKRAVTKVIPPPGPKKSKATVSGAIAVAVLVLGALVYFAPWKKSDPGGARSVVPQTSTSEGGQGRDGARPSSASPATTIKDAPTDVLTFNGHRYQFVRGSIKWTEAKVKAEAMGGHLATLATREEAEWAKKTYLTREYTAMWLGGYRTPDNHWHWVTDEPWTFADWARWKEGGGEPGDHSKGPGSAPLDYLELLWHERYIPPGGWDDTHDDVSFPASYQRGMLVEWDDAGGVASSRPSSALTATKESPFVNTLGMKFVPVPILGGPTAGKTVLFSVWDTRVQDYGAFVKETKREWPKVDFEQGPTHPAANVSWDDATAFCAWLTTREQAAGRLPAGLSYRLPGDYEWSCAVGLGAAEDAATLPAEKSGKNSDVFPWGVQWPPPQKVGNYAGEELQPVLAAGKYAYVKGVIAGYNDGFVNTSPAGSFTANRFGLFDMSGNVWQWCGDWFDREQKERVLRGSSWDNSARIDLLSSDRRHIVPNERSTLYGFRCVLAPVSASATSAIPSPTATGPWIDLLPLVDVKRDEVQGTWSRKPEGLALESSYKFGVCELPYEPPEEYDFMAEFTPTSGGNNVDIHLYAGGASFLWKINAHHRTPPIHGLDMLDGKFMPNRTEAVVTNPLHLEIGQRYSTEVQVRRNSLRASVNGSEIFQWSGDYHRLSTETDAQLRDPRVLGIGSYGRAVIFHKAAVREISGPGRMTAAPAATGSPAVH